VESGNKPAAVRADTLRRRNGHASRGVLLEREKIMNRTLATGLTFAALAFSGAVAAQTAAPSQPAGSGETATAAFVDGEGNSTGEAQLRQTPAGVLIQLNVTGLPADHWVAFHIHETGTCDAATHHESAGGHFNPTGASHGYLADGGPHAGDMPNQMTRADGRLEAEVLNPSVTLASIVGRSLMIHAGQDDYRSQPSGAAGDRLACAPIR